ncbi:hypothetical protein MTO96_037815 [Rhipicephalus appendiculatus]
MEHVAQTQAEAVVSVKANHEAPTVIVPDGKTKRAADVATKRPSSPASEMTTKSVVHTQCRVVHELAKNLQSPVYRDDSLPVSKVSTAAETPPPTPSFEMARRKKK